MAHKKAGGTVKNLRDSNPKYLGIKIADGQSAQAGSIVVRQRGTRFTAGDNVRIGRDHTVYATAPGKVKFGSKRMVHFDGTSKQRKVVSVVSQ